MRQTLSPTIPLALGILLAAATACSSDSDGPNTSDASVADVSQTDDSASSDDSSSSDAVAAPDPEALHACKMPVTEFIPLKSARYDQEAGGLQGERNETYIVHTTRLFPRPESLERVFELSDAIIRDLAAIDGLVAVGLANSECGDARTIGIWESEAALYQAVALPSHTLAMSETTTVSFTGKTTHWTATADEVDALTWDDADAHLDAVAISPAYGR